MIISTWTILATDITHTYNVWHLDMEHFRSLHAQDRLLSPLIGWIYILLLSHSHQSSLSLSLSLTLWLDSLLFCWLLLRLLLLLLLLYRGINRSKKRDIVVGGNDKANEIQRYRMMIIQWASHREATHTYTTKCPVTLEREREREREKRKFDFSLIDMRSPISLTALLRCLEAKKEKRNARCTQEASTTRHSLAFYRSKYVFRATVVVVVVVDKRTNAACSTVCHSVCLRLFASF